MNTKRSKKLIVCDVEGTIFKADYQIDGVDYSSTMWQPLARSLGKEAIQFEQEFAKKWEEGNYHSYLDWVDETSEMHKKLKLEKVVFQQLLRKAEYADGVVDFFKDLDREKYIPILISGGFQELVDRALKELKIEYGVGACTYGFNNKGILTSKTLYPSDFEGKCDYIEMLAKHFQINLLTDWIYIGDGKNDKYIAEIAPVTIAVNGHEDLNNVDGIIEAKNFLEINKIIQSLTHNDFYKKHLSLETGKLNPFQLKILGRMFGWFYMATLLLREWLILETPENKQDRLIEEHKKKYSKEKYFTNDEFNSFINGLDLSDLLSIGVTGLVNKFIKPSKSCFNTSNLIDVRNVRNRWSHLTLFPNYEEIVSDLMKLVTFFDTNKDTRKAISKDIQSLIFEIEELSKLT